MVDLRGETDARATALREIISLKLSTSDPKMKREKTTRVSSERGRTRGGRAGRAVAFAGHGDRPRDARRSAREGLDDPGYGPTAPLLRARRALRSRQYLAGLTFQSSGI